MLAAPAEAALLGTRGEHAAARSATDEPARYSSRPPCDPLRARVAEGPVKPLHAFATSEIQHSSDRAAATRRSGPTQENPSPDDLCQPSLPIAGLPHITASA